MSDQLIKVKVNPGSKKNEIKQSGPNTFEVSVKAKPHRGQANEAVRALLAGHLKIPINNVRIVTGRLSTHKTIEIKG